MKTLTLLPDGQYDVTVNQVTDGDTIHVLVPVAVKIRLAGIQAAELATPKGKTVAAWLKQRIEGKPVLLTLGSDYKYGGERMGSVSIDGVDVAQEMIAAGLAVKWDGRGPRPVGREEIEAMTTDEKVELLMAEREQERAADKRLADATGRGLVGPDGGPLTPTKAAREPFDWGALWAQLTPYVFRILTLALAAFATYFGVDASHKAGQASSHAEAAVVQSKENEKKITAAHEEAKHSSRQLDRLAGNAADRVPKE